VASWQADWLPRLAVLAQDRRLAALVTLLLVVLLAKALASLTWTLLPASEEGMAAAVLPAAVPVQARPAAANKVSAVSIERLHLFGEAAKAAPKPVAKVVDAPDTRLNLKLRGVLASNNPAIARAIIADGKGQEDAYAVDDKLPGDAVLKEIHADRILLEYRGRLETLRLPKEANTKTAGNRTVTRGRNGRSALSISASSADTGALLRQYRDHRPAERDGPGARRAGA